MKNSFGFRLAGLSLCLFLFGTTASASQYQIPPEILALIKAQQEAQLAQKQPASTPITYSCAALTPACSPCAPSVRPTFTNLDWSSALGQGAKKAVGHACGMFVFSRILDFVTRSWIPAFSCEKIATSSALLGALTVLSYRYKKQCMRYFETEQSCESTLHFASAFLPGMSGKTLAATGTIAGCYLLYGPYY